MTNEITTTVTPNGPALFRASTDAAGLCKEIVIATARNIQGRKYVQVEGWQAIAIAHGCVASAGGVERISGGFRAIGRVIRMDNGQEIATAEGFVGDDESMWAKRPEYARRAMAQTRAISRACRSAFAHVVVMMNAGLSTTPAEEVPESGFDEHFKQSRDITPQQSQPIQAAKVEKPKAPKPEPIIGKSTVIEGEVVKPKPHARGTITGDQSEGDLSQVAPLRPAQADMDKMLAAFAKIGMDAAAVEKEYNKHLTEWTAEDLIEAREVFKVCKQDWDLKQVELKSMQNKEEVI